MHASPFRLTAAALLTLVAGAAFAQSKDIVADPKGDVPYAIDSRNVVVKSGADLCWRTGSWTPAAAAAAKAGDTAIGCQCDPDVVDKGACAPAAAKEAAPATPAAPVAAPVAVAAAPKKCDFSAVLQADSTFGFNQATLTKTAREALDKNVIAKLGGCASISSVIVTGHTDRLGTQAYNQKLSEKRAESVLAYLQSKGVKADHVDTMGAGKTQPIQSCDDKLGHKKLVACLAPNRRVTVDVKGSAK
jgi:OOP family OmpA-OmpF porin